MSTHESGTPTPDQVPPDSGGDESGSQRPAPQNELPRWATRPSSSTPFSDARMAAYIGPRWESKYRTKLASFFADPTFNVTWNWSAALGSPFWFLYRKLYLAFVLFCFLPNVALSMLVSDVDASTLSNPESPEAMHYLIMLGAVALSTSIAAGGTANWFLFRRARFRSLVVSMQQVPEEVAISRLRQMGGVSLRSVGLFFVIAFGFAMMVSASGVR